LTEKPDFKWVVGVTALVCLRLQVKGKGGRRLWEEPGPGDEPNVPSRVKKKIGISASLRFGFGYSDIERWKPAVRDIRFD
jgi:hypothetical protein